MRDREGETGARGKKRGSKREVQDTNSEENFQFYKSSTTCKMVPELNLHLSSFQTLCKAVYMWTSNSGGLKKWSNKLAIF